MSRQFGSSEVNTFFFFPPSARNFSKCRVRVSDPEGCTALRKKSNKKATLPRDSKPGPKPTNSHARWKESDPSGQHNVRPEDRCYLTVCVRVPVWKGDCEREHHTLNWASSHPRAHTNSRTLTNTRTHTRSCREMQKGSLSRDSWLQDFPWVAVSQPLNKVDFSLSRVLFFF